MRVVSGPAGSGWSGAVGPFAHPDLVVYEAAVEWMRDLGLTVRATNCLLGARLYTPDAVRAVDDLTLLRIKNLGRRVLSELYARGLRPNSCPHPGCEDAAGHAGEHRVFGSGFVRPPAPTPAPPIILTDDELFFAVSSSVRYSLGRATGAVHDAVSLVRRTWRRLSPPARQVVERDVRRALEDADRAGRFLGHEVDDRDWRELLRFMVADRKRG